MWLLGQRSCIFVTVTVCLINMEIFIARQTALKCQSSDRKKSASTVRSEMIKLHRQGGYAFNCLSVCLSA